MLYTKPSFYALAFTGILYLFIMIILVKKWNTLNKLEPYKLITVLSLIGILIGVHGIIHLGLEKVYNYNPLDYYYY